MASQPAEEEPTVVAPQPSDQARTGETLPPADHEQTVVEPQAPEEAEQPVEDPAEARRRRREERDRMLGTRRPVLDPEPDTTVDEPRLKPTTDKFFGAFGLFLLRVVAAAIIGLHGFAKAMDIEAVQQMLANTVIPEPVIVSYVLTGAEVGIALPLGRGWARCDRHRRLGVCALGRQSVRGQRAHRGAGIAARGGWCVVPAARGGRLECGRSVPSPTRSRDVVRPTRDAGVRSVTFDAL